MSQVNNLIDALQYPEAKVILLEKMNLFPNNTEVMDTLSEVLIALNEIKDAKILLKKSIEIEPNKNPEKFMSLAQLSDFKESLNLYKKGIELYLNELNFFTQNTNTNSNIEDNSEKIKKIRTDLASGYSSIAELYMNSDLW